MMTPPQTVDGMCPKNRPRILDSIHEHDIISNRKAAENVSPKLQRPAYALAPAPVDLSPPKVHTRQYHSEARDQRMPLNLPATPPKRMMTTNQEKVNVLFRGSPPVSRLRDSGRLPGFSGHKQGLPR